jgi:hypothetical protein
MNNLGGIIKEKDEDSISINSFNNSNFMNHSLNTNSINSNNTNYPTININNQKNPNLINKKPKITYDDILNSLNLKVNNGKLEVLPNTFNPHHSHYNQFKTCYKKQLNANNNNINNNNRNLPIPENSYIINKYFKDYRFDNSIQNQRERIPITKEEYKKLIILELIRKKEEQKRIAQIKTKKLLFARNNINAPANSIPNNLNKLFRF